MRRGASLWCLGAFPFLLVCVLSRCSDSPYDSTQVDVAGESCNTCSDLPTVGEVAAGGGEYEDEPVPMNCGDGWISCHLGVMNISASGHVAPWSNCQESGFSWPCQSGSCGEFELCEDDIDAFNEMLSTPVEWADGSVTLEAVGEPSKAPLNCVWPGCTWTLRSAEGEVILKVSLGTTGQSAFGPVKTTAVDGATNVVSSVFSPSEILSLELGESPVDAQQITLRWAPMPETGMEEPTPEPGMGLGAGIAIMLADGDSTTIVWRLRANVYNTTNVPVVFAMQP